MVDPTYRGQRQARSIGTVQRIVVLTFDLIAGRRHQRDAQPVLAFVIVIVSYAQAVIACSQQDRAALAVAIVSGVKVVDIVA